MGHIRKCSAPRPVCVVIGSVLVALYLYATAVFKVKSIFCAQDATLYL